MCYFGHIFHIIIKTQIDMSELLTERLSVVGQEHLRQSFSSALRFAFNGIRFRSEEKRQHGLSLIERFTETPAANFRFCELCFQKPNFNLWLQCLSGEVYALGCFEQHLHDKMQPLFANPEIRIDSFWQTYAGIYARELLLLSSQTLCNPANGFNPETMQSFISHPEKAQHGAELINDIPPLLEKGYIYLNNCGEDQHTDWHRNTFMESCFKALMSYRNILSEPAIRRAFKVS